MLPLELPGIAAIIRCRKIHVVVPPLAGLPGVVPGRDGFPGGGILKKENVR
jgi:hypothetical protein